MQDIDAVRETYSGRSQIVLDYSKIIKDLTDRASIDADPQGYWAPLARLVDTAAFVRVGNFKEVMNWAEYTAFLTAWAPHAQWECSFKRISEVGDVVFLELEERTTISGVSNAVNSLSVYEFTADDKIAHIDIYLQMPMPDPAMLQGYEGVQLPA